MKKIIFAENISRKKFFLACLTTFYTFSILLNAVYYATLSTSAESKKENRNIVAIFIDKNIKTAIQSDLERYTTTYIQKRNPGTIGLVIPIDIQTINAHDIVKILENLYFEGIKNNVSALIGTILIGDIPLPVVKNKDYVFPSIYPYVDLVERKFSYNPTTKFFEKITDVDGGQPEIFHSLIKYGTTEKYKKFFEKLRTYDSNPNNYATTNIRYEDFVQLKENFNAGYLDKYLNRFPFAEDLIYHRYTQLLIKLLNNEHTQKTKDNFDNFANSSTDLTNESEGSEELSNAVEEYNSALTSYKNMIKNLGLNTVMDGDDNTSSPSTPQSNKKPDSDLIPTLFLTQSFELFFKKFSQIYADKYHQSMRDRLNAGGMSIEQVDSFQEKITFRDELIQQKLLNYNTKLEEIWNQKVESGRYYLDVPLLRKYKLFENVGLCVTRLEGEYDNFFFGNNANDIYSVTGLTIYRGTYGNFTGTKTLSGMVPTLTGIYTISGGIDDITGNLDLNMRSVVSSLTVSRTQVQAHRGHNVLLAMPDKKIYDDKKCEDDQSMTDFIKKYRAGATPLNLTSDVQDPQKMVMYYFDRLRMRQKSFSHGGGKKLEKKETPGNTYEAITAYNSLIRVKFQPWLSPVLMYAWLQLVATFPLAAGIPPLDSVRETDFCKDEKKPKLGQETNYFKVIIGEGIDPKTIIYVEGPDGKQEKTIGGGCGYEEFFYKSIPSINFHTSVTTGELMGTGVNEMNVTTPDRPIDTPRYMTFKSYSGSKMTLVYPNVFNISVFKSGTQNNIVLKSTGEIEESIKIYLREKIKHYNTELKSAFDLRLQEYNRHTEAYNILGATNKYATPNRNYDDMTGSTYIPIPEDYFINKLGEEIIKSIAENLYYLNTPRQERLPQTDILSHLTTIKSTADVNKKIIYTLDRYLKQEGDTNELRNPTYQKNGYQLGYINSDGMDIPENNELPGLISTLEEARSTFLTNNRFAPTELKPTTTTAQESEKKIDNKCKISKDGTVPLLKRPVALKCWLEETLKNPIKLEFSFADAEWGVFAPHYFDDVENATNEKTFDTIISGSTLQTNLETYNQDIKEFGNERKELLGIDKENEKVLSNTGSTNLFALGKMISSTTFQKQPERFILGEQETSTLVVNASQDVGKVRLQLYSKFPQCLEVGGKNSCAGGLTITENFFINSYPISIKTIGKKPQTVILLAKLCLDNAPTECLTKTIQYDILPGLPSTYEFGTPGSHILQGGQLPFAITAKDKFGNPINQLTENQILNIQNAVFLFNNGTTGTSAEFNNTRELFGFIEAPQNNNLITTSIKNENGTSDIASARYEIVNGIAKVSERGIALFAGTQTIRGITIQLPEDVNEIVSPDKVGIVQVHKEKLSEITIDLTSTTNIPLNSPVDILSENNLIEAGHVKEKEIEIEGGNTKQKVIQHYFDPQTSNYLIKNGKLTIALRPLFKAGQDNLIINIPGYQRISIPITIKPASAKKVSIHIEKNSLPLNETNKVFLKVSDVYNNPITDPTLRFDLQILGNATINNLKKTTIANSNNVSVTVTPVEPGGKVYVTAVLNGVNLTNHSPDYGSFVIKNTLFPMTELNVMYLSLFGEDRGNPIGYASDNNNLQEKIFDTSKKLLAMTTQSINPSYIKKTSFSINDNLIITNEGNHNLSLTINNGKIMVNVEKIANIPLGELSSFTIKSLSGIDEILPPNTIGYLAEPTDSTIEQNTVIGKNIVINNEGKINFSNGNISNDISIEGEFGKPFGNNNREVIYKPTNKKLGTLVIKGQGTYITSNSASVQIENNEFEKIITFAEGTTNGIKGLAIIDNKSDSLAEQKLPYKSIELSRNTEENIGFTADFANIGNFMNGQNVGNASKFSASEYVINYGDPFIERLSNNTEIPGTDLDAGGGMQIYESSDDKQIKYVVDIDFNSDGLKDILIAKENGQIEILKNYGGNGQNNFVNQGNLMFVEDGILFIKAGDVDGDSDQDIIIQTDKNFIRVYENRDGQFDVNGKLVCLDLPGGPEQGETVQTFFEDMNKDGAIDIITNDINGRISIFYGGNIDGKPRYLTTDPTGLRCDVDRQSRQKIKVVKNYGLKINAQQKIRDQSLITRLGAVSPQEVGDTNAPGPINIPEIQSADDMGNFSVTELIGSGTTDLVRYVDLPLNALPVYESRDNRDSVTYIKTMFLKDSDPVDTYKTFEDLNGGALLRNDFVKVTIHLQARQNRKATYMEKLSGPFAILKKPNDPLGSLLGFQTEGLNSDVIKNFLTQDDTMFTIDNISLPVGQTTAKISYIVQFVGSQPIRIEVGQFFGDEYLDIKTLPRDGCMPGYRGFTAIANGTNYTESFINIKEKLQERENALIQNMSGMINDAGSGIQNASGMDNLMDLPQLQQIREQFDIKNILGTDSLSNPVSLNVDLFTEEAQKLSTKIDEVANGLCKGMSFGKKPCSGVPVPFNMAFLSPGTYNIFGCKLMEDKGLPIFHFPGTLQTPVGPVPIPRGLKGPGDGFYRAPGGAYPSLIRIYISPTLTLGMGFALCFGPYSVGRNIPNPLKHVGGNCVVFAVKPPDFCKNNSDQNAGGEDTSKVDEITINDWQKDLGAMGACNVPPGSTQYPSSPLTLESSDGYTSYSSFGISIPLTQTTTTTPINQGRNAQDLGTINIPEPVARTTLSSLEGDNNLIGLERIPARSGKPIKLQIKGGNVKGLMKCIIQTWLDNQIRYIINNLTNMTISLYLPDVTELFQGFNKISSQNMKNLSDGPVFDGKGLVSDMGSFVTTNTTDTFGKGVLEKVSTKLNNPFDVLSQMFNNIPLVDINTRDINISIPFIYQEDITRYDAFLKAWIQTNRKIIKERERLIVGIAAQCNKIDGDQFAKDACNSKLSEYVSIVERYGQLIRSVRQNIKVLQEYKAFPLQLYEFIHIHDRYIVEVSNIVDAFTTNIMGWMETNARRFEKFVDAIILIIGTIKTRQILVDFSINRQSKCGKCTNDNYDFYSCTLSLLCINLPILPIPPFKLPDITLDFSHIDLGIDILLPKFNFAPTKLPLMRIPDLPLPPTLTLDLKMPFLPDVPSIPVLPSPPKLPELPSFLPTIKIELPNLPPAPKIPRISPKIEGVIKVIDVVAQILCIIKGGIGLVGEKGVKTRIEHMTQRSREVNPFDSLSITNIQPPRFGFDLRVDSYLQLKFFFDDFYDYVKTAVDKVNDQTNKAMEGVTKSVENFNKESTAFGEKRSEQSIQSKLKDEIKKLDRGDQDSYYNTSEGIEYETAYIKLKKDLVLLQSHLKDPTQAESIINTIENPSGISANKEGINKIENETQKLLNQKRSEIKKLSESIYTNYDKFLDTIAQPKLTNSTTIETQLGTTLFNASDKTKELLATQEHPLKTYVDLNKKLVDGFQNALEKNSPTSLNMTPYTYMKNKNYLENMKNIINESEQKLVENNSTPKKITALPTRNPSGTPANSTPINTNPTPPTQIDYSQYVKGFFVEAAEGEKISVMGNIERGDKIMKNDRFKKIDINNDGKNDYLLHDENSVRIKYGKQNSQEPQPQIQTKFYQLPTINSAKQLEDISDAQGYLTTNNIAFKVHSKTLGVIGFTINGQNFENIAFKRIHTPVDFNGTENIKIDGYLLKLTPRIDNFDLNNPNTEIKYLMVVPENSSTGGDELFVLEQNLNNTLDELLSDGKLLKVETFDEKAGGRDGDQTDLNVKLENLNLEQKRQYVQITKLNKQGTRREKISPRSNQHVGGTQQFGDDQLPGVTISLLRERKNLEEVMIGNELQGNILTYYAIKAEGVDNGKIAKMRFEKDEKVLVATQTGSVTLSGVFSTGTTQFNYFVGVQDHAGNINKIPVSLTTIIPKPSISEIGTEADGFYVVADLESKIHNDIDEGIIKFSRLRNAKEKVLSGRINTTYQTNFLLTTNQESATGKIFETSDKIGLFNTNDDLIATIDGKNGEIIIQNNYRSRVSTYIDFSKQRPLIIFQDSITSKKIFDVYIRSKEITSLNAISPYKKTAINTANAGVFNGGSCIKANNNECVMYITTKGQIFVPEPFHTQLKGTYSFSITNGVTYTIRDINNNTVASVSFTIEPFIP